MALILSASSGTGSTASPVGKVSQRRTSLPRFRRKRHCPSPRRHGGERGAEILEFGLILGALMMLLMGIVSFSRAYNIYQTITRATREGVREAVLPTAVSAGNQLTYSDSPTYSDPACSVSGSSAPTTNSPATPIFTGFIAPALQASSLNPSEVRNYSECLTWLDPNSTSSKTDDPEAQCGVQVSFQYPVRLNIPFLPALPTQFYVGTSVQMRLENQPVSASGAQTCP